VQPHPRTPLDHHRKPLFGIVALLALVAACTPVPEPASVVGTVIDADTLAPLAGTQVVARVAGTTGVVATDTSDALGAFVLTPLTAGVHDIDLDHVGYAPRTSPDVATTAGATTDLGAVGLTPVATASIIGSVVDANTLAPLTGAAVVARATGTATVVATSTSDAQGAFTLEPFTAGVYDVAFEHFGYAPQARANVTIVAGATADLGAVGLAAYAPSRLYGSVASDEEFSMPLTGARVDARIAGTTTVIATDFADEHGAFDLDPVPAGTYDVELSRSGYVPLLVEDVVAPPGGAANVGDRKLVPIAP
jgi:hypothetical protein